ncbi:MAG: phosphatidylglycerophosphatase A [Lentilactobacillus diolivorans]|jgi:phosphatidylglycerophosphatase A|uniref:Phosphatidylglycerophosphatase A n=2 Tax=Lentilactobacillus diolivorans TaxID=179838 RepID=A0A0R1RZQ6_9LACO|nr:phosphatidylglycerophosphatase A [Lentilactobacillus diolivorans]RRG02514.1 MAG: phosphatidylglycerophosphatase A [Lactobacillus sp.]KRL62415.1 phosphatidylglycerophosphatase A [Lentilactobacillus diolivorans DSM 14421]MCH4163923.1 phosphatidylglycerophosphatase A [Lentilactobacillus diolivorans]MDH5105132.1 phosphatidylglycerophosphatase A [Lentilactobacillus diolivorans]GEP24990.1 phosphatidylglycerophosphatase A [Lentilactobacillus diolivorans]
MNNKNFKFPDTAAYNFVISALEERGVTPEDISKLAFKMQQQFIPDITMDEARKATTDVLHKREVLNNAMVGLELDRLATQGLLKEPLESIIMNDSGVFGVDEGIALNIANIYGTIGVTNYGYIDRDKSGIVKQLDEAKDGTSNTFIDDIVGAIASAVSAKIAHQNN